MRYHSPLHAINKRSLFLPALIGIIMLAVSCGDMYSGYFSSGKLGPAPEVDGITPNTGVDPNLVPGITVTGSNFASGAVVRLTRAGYPSITASNVVVVSDTEIQCDIILPGAMYGPWNVTVTNLDKQTGTLANAFTVTWPDPTLAAITPNSGSEPNTVYITNLAGAHLMSGATVRLIRGASIITATGVTAVSPTQITCSFDLAGAASGAWDVELTNPVGGPATLTGAFTVGWDAPTVASITPNNGDDPATITSAGIVGTNFKAGATVRLTKAGESDIIATGVAFVDSAHITCNIPLSGAMYGPWNVVVENTDGQSAARANAFTVNWPDVTLTSISPNSGNEPDTVSVTLTGTHFMSGASVQLTDGITDIEATGVTVNSSGTQITCQFSLAGAGYGDWDVVITNPTGPSDTLSGVFTVSWDAPTVTGISPASGTEPGTVIITDLAGTNFKDGASVRLSRSGYSDINASNVIVVSDTRITCRFTLAGAMWGDWDVVVTNTDTQSGSRAGCFTVNWPAPTLASISPSSGGDSVPVTLVGTNFKDGASVRLVRSGYTDIIAAGVTVVSATQITCTIDVTSAMYGDWDVVVENADSQTATRTNAFTVNWPAPTLTAASYDLWKCATATITNLAGTGFKPGAAVRLTRTGYSDIPAGMVTVVSGTQITCQFDLTAAAAGSWNIAFENTDGQSAATLANGATLRDSLYEDWESGSVWHFPWVYDGPDTIGLATQINDGTPLGSQCLSIMSTAAWTYYDGMHAVFEGGFQPTYVSFRIRKDWDDSCDIFINLGDDYTSGNSGAIFFHWASAAGTMSVQGGGGISAAYNAFHTVEFRNINFSTQRFDFHVDGALITANIPFYNAVGSFTRMYISAGWWAQSAYIDDIEMY